MALLEVDNLSVTYDIRGTSFRAVDGVSMCIDEGETVGLVGESGCGKSSLGKAIMRLQPASGGSIRLHGDDITKLNDRSMLPYRRQMQMVFQDPFGSLNPRQSVGQLLEGPLKAQKLYSRPERKRKVAEILEKVGLPLAATQRYPHEFSGGQRQRIGIARALVLKPQVVVCDEPVSALDLSVQSQILNLLTDLKRDLKLSYIFISHDLSVVRYFADRVLVMYLGAIVESADYNSLWKEPRHPYTRALFSAVPVANPQHRRKSPAISGELPTAPVVDGCRFRTRCPLASAQCSQQVPLLREVAPGHSVACHFA